MAINVVSWVRGKARQASGEKPESGPKTMAEKRVHHLTPSSSHESLVINPQQSCIFFASLSAELRIAILTLAFGDRTYHIHAPEAKKPSQKSKRFGLWSRKQAIHPEQAFRLSGAICKRIRYVCSEDGVRRYDPGVFQDHCWYPSDGDGFLPAGLFFEIGVGATGWLLSCRQAYVEGIEILYGTNTFHITQPRVAGMLDKHFLPQRLERIQSLELALEWGARGPVEGQKSFEMQLARILRNVSEQMPRLTKLEIAFQDDMPCFHLLAIGSHESDFAKWANTHIFTPLDSMVQLMPQIRECRLWFTTMMPWGRRWSLEKIDGMQIVEGAKGLWRGVGQEGRGYWVLMGKEDTPGMICGTAFG